MRNSFKKSEFFCIRFRTLRIFRDKKFFWPILEGGLHIALWDKT